MTPSYRFTVPGQSWLPPFLSVSCCPRPPLESRRRRGFGSKLSKVIYSVPSWQVPSTDIKSCWSFRPYSRVKARLRVLSTNMRPVVEVCTHINPATDRWAVFGSLLLPMRMLGSSQAAVVIGFRCIAVSSISENSPQDTKSNGASSVLGVVLFGSFTVGSFTSALRPYMMPFKGF